MVAWLEDGIHVQDGEQCHTLPLFNAENIRAWAGLHNLATGIVNRRRGVITTANLVLLADRCRHPDYFAHHAARPHDAHRAAHSFLPKPVQLRRQNLNLFMHARRQLAIRFHFQWVRKQVRFCNSQHKNNSENS
jgi:hypothetical protein